MSHAYNEQSSGGNNTHTIINEITKQLGRVDDVGLYPFTARCEQADLSGAGTYKVVFLAERAYTLYKAYLLYCEASSADAGVTLRIGKPTDDDYYYTGTSEISKSQWYVKEVTLLKTDVVAGDAITFYSAGGKVGTGEVACVLEYQFTP